MNYVYLLRCSDDTLYCGWTNNLDKRLKMHNSGKGAKYTKARLPVKLVYYEEYEDKTEAQKREWFIHKKMRREEKLRLIESFRKRGNQMDIERVKENETYLNECTEATAALNEQLDRMDAVREHMINLFSYYGSEAWYDDREGKIPEGVAAGVLSEDLVYDRITEVRDAAFRMLELATDILKNRI